MTSATVVKKGDVVGYVDDSFGSRTPVVAAADLTVTGWPGMGTQLTLATDAQGMPHSAKGGTAVGTLTLRSGPVAEAQVPVALQYDLTAPDFSKRLSRLG
ncbi:hypothetical protein [Kitasatospora acidiphila]|uniref:hypothetical protein n=1 Tax=Kitasatospora acidiphila TaxID=2567942 RepID=UPI003C7133A2